MNQKNTERNTIHTFRKAGTTTLLLGCLLAGSVTGVSAADSELPHLSYTGTRDNESGGYRLTVTAENTAELEYTWDFQETPTVVQGNGTEPIVIVSEPIGEQAGTYTLYITATAANGNIYQVTHNCTFEEDYTENEDITPPLLDVFPSGTVAAGSEILLTATDAGQLKHIEYQWKSQSEPTMVTLHDGEKSVQFPVGTLTAPGEYTLTVQVQDIADNYVRSTYSFIVEESVTTAPQTFDFGLTGLIAAGVSLAGLLVSKKK